MALISLGLITTVHPAAIAGATLMAIEPALEFHGVKYAHHARRFHDDFGSPDSSCQIEVLENFFEVQENVGREVVGAPRAVLRGAVFQNRRVNELIHSLGNGIMQPLQAVHAVFLAAFLRKGIERLLGRGDGLSGVDLIRHGDLADNRVVGRVDQINDLGSMGCDELAVDVGAIKGSYQELWFRFRSFAFTLMTFSNLCPTSPSLSGTGYNSILAE